MSGDDGLAGPVAAVVPKMRACVGIVKMCCGWSPDLPPAIPLLSRFHSWDKAGGEAGVSVLVVLGGHRPGDTCVKG